MNDYERALAEQDADDRECARLTRDEKLRRHRKRRVAFYVLLLLLLPALIALEEIPRYAAIAPDLCPTPDGLKPCPLVGPYLGGRDGNGNGTGGNGNGTGKNGKGSGQGTGGWGGDLVHANLPSDMTVETPNGSGRSPASRPSLYGDTQRTSVPRAGQGREVALANTPRETQHRESELASAARAPSARDGIALVQRTPEARQGSFRPDLYSPPPQTPPPPQYQAPPPQQPPPPAPNLTPPTAPPTNPEPAMPPAIPTVVPRADQLIGPYEPQPTKQ